MQRQNPPGMRAITVSRQYGSGGGEIAARLARQLQWHLIDHEIVARVAHQLGISEQEAAVHDEHVEGFISRALGALQFASPIVPVAATSPEHDELVYDEALRQVVLTAADTGHVVIVGRTGQVFLANRRDVLHVRIVAPLHLRIAYVARREGLDEAAAQARIHLKDRDRERYIQTRHNRDVNDPMLYDLVINTGLLGLESAIDLAITALERKARRLTISTGELGPAAGMARYAGQPADLRPPGEQTL